MLNSENLLELYLYLLLIMQEGHTPCIEQHVKDISLLILIKLKSTSCTFSLEKYVRIMY